MYSYFVNTRFNLSEKVFKFLNVKVYVLRMSILNYNNIYFFPVSKTQIYRLWNRFQSLDKAGKGHLTREDFQKIPELETNPLGDRIVQAFFQDSQEIR